MTPAAPDSPEIGRELKYADLPDRKRTVLVLQKEGTKIFSTHWLFDVTPIMVFFYTGVGNTMLGLIPQPDGTLHDGLNRQIHVFEYLGEV
jgi:hypothetical protein